MTDDLLMQCVLGTIVDSYFRGYDCVALRDCIATTSPQGGLENVFYNCGNVRHCFIVKVHWSLSYCAELRLHYRLGPSHRSSREGC